MRTCLATTCVIQLRSLFWLYEVVEHSKFAESYGAGKNPKIGKNSNLIYMMILCRANKILWHIPESLLNVENVLRVSMIRAVLAPMPCLWLLI